MIDANQLVLRVFYMPALLSNWGEARSVVAAPAARLIPPPPDVYL